MLDPTDWELFRAQGHRMLDDMVDYLQTIRERPVWQQAPESAQAYFHHGIPRHATPLPELHDTFMQHILPYSVGNTHPGFMGWVHGGGTPVGMLAEMLAGGLNANLGGRNQIPIEVERQVIGWMRDLFGFPAQSSGVLTTGTSAATLIALVTARDAAQQKHPNATTWAAYTSTQAHGCIARALKIMGWQGCLRKIPCLDDHTINLAALQQAITEDQQHGIQPWLIIGTAGSVNTGAVDDLQGLAQLAKQCDAWLHVDGAFGALALLSPQLAPRFRGIESADSLAMDFHKWGQVPYDAGLILIRDGEQHRQSFAAADAYLQREEQGLAANSPWPCDYGLELSRGFRALKIWFTFQSLGTARLAEMIEQSCALAQQLGEWVKATPTLELMAEVSLNIVCFRYCGDQSLSPERYDAINRAIIVHIQQSGLAAPSLTFLRGRAVIRAAIVNHRTQQEDIGKLLAATLVAVQACQSTSSRSHSDATPFTFIFSP